MGHLTQPLFWQITVGRAGLIFHCGNMGADRRRYMIGLPDIFKWEYGAPDAATVLVTTVGKAGLVYSLWEYGRLTVGETV